MLGERGWSSDLFRSAGWLSSAYANKRDASQIKSITLNILFKTSA